MSKRDHFGTGTLFLRELRFRGGSFLLAVAAVAAVAACIVGSRGFLSAHDAETDRLVSELADRAAERMARLRDDARVFSKSLGFNILLLPAAQDPGRLYTEHRSDAFFTMEQADALGQARLATLNHLLPMLRHRVHWKALGGDVVLVGVKGEIYIKAPAFQKPIEERIEPGSMHVGFAIADRLGLESGDLATLQGERFTVGRVLPQKGNVDDTSLLMNLADVQRVAGLPGKVTGVLALSCMCAAGELNPIRDEVSRVLPDVRVVEFAIRARARQRAREAIGQGTREEMADIEASREAMRTQLGRFAVLLVSLVTIGTMVLLVAQATTSGRERRPEIAMLRALGLGSGKILLLFLCRALLAGVAGGISGSLAVIAVSHLTVGTGSGVGVGFVVLTIGAAVTITALSAIGPAALAARTDPAVILNAE